MQNIWKFIKKYDSWFKFLAVSIFLNLLLLDLFFDHPKWKGLIFTAGQVSLAMLMYALISILTRAWEEVRKGDH